MKRKSNGIFLVESKRLVKAYRRNHEGRRGVALLKIVGIAVSRVKVLSARFIWNKGGTAIESSFL